MPENKNQWKIIVGAASPYACYFLLGTVQPRFQNAAAGRESRLEAAPTGIPASKFFFVANRLPTGEIEQC